MSVIDVDDPSTWPSQVPEHVEDHAARLVDTTKHTSDLAISPEEEDEFRATLAGAHLTAYHATRLLDHEIDAIQRDGLTPASEDLVRSRIDAARELGHITDPERKDLLARNLFGAGDYVGNREGQVSFFLSRRVLDHSVDGIWRLMTTWGGEVIYFGSGFTDRVEARLKLIGQPAVVVAALDLTDSWRVHPAFPGLLHSFVGKDLGLEPYDSDIFYRAPVPGEQILDIWLPGDPEYDRHAHLPRAVPQFGPV